MGTGATTARPTSIAVIRMLGSGATRTHPGQQVPWYLHRIPLSAPDPLRLPPGLLPPPLPLGPGDVGGGGGEGADPKNEVFAKLKLGRVQVSRIVNETGLSISPSLFWQNA